MVLFQINFSNWCKKLVFTSRLATNLIIDFKIININFFNILEQMKLVGPDSLSICLLTAFFIGMVFTLQVVKEFLYLDAVSLVGAVITIAFIRELSPVLTSVVIVGRVCSCFTAELASMKNTEQIDALYLFNTDPLSYLVLPRVLSLVLMLPILNFFSFTTSIASSSFICSTLYSIDSTIFLASSFSCLSLIDIIKSSFKTMIFGFIISTISCSWGLTTSGGAQGVGKSTTSAVVTCLLAIFVFDFLLSYFMFSKLDSTISVL